MSGALAGHAYVHSVCEHQTCPKTLWGMVLSLPVHKGVNSSMQYRPSVQTPLYSLLLLLPMHSGDNTPLHTRLAPPAFLSGFSFCVM